MGVPRAKALLSHTTQPTVSSVGTTPTTAPVVGPPLTAAVRGTQLTAAAVVSPLLTTPPVVGLLGSHAHPAQYFSSQYCSPPPPPSAVVLLSREEESISSEDGFDTRVVDSGASHHMTGDRSIFRGFVRTCNVSVGGISDTLTARGVGHTHQWC